MPHILPESSRWYVRNYVRILFQGGVSLEESIFLFFFQTCVLANSYFRSRNLGFEVADVILSGSKSYCTVPARSSRTTRHCQRVLDVPFVPESFGQLLHGTFFCAQLLERPVHPECCIII
jgi:hypothetical protein